MVNKIKTKLLLTSLASVSLVGFMSCSTVINSVERTNQINNLLRNSDVFLDNKLLTEILNFEYSKSGTKTDTQKAFEDKTSSYFTESWAAFDFYQAYKLKNDPLYFVNKISEWAAKGYLSQDGTADSNLDTIKKLQLGYNQSLTQDQFILIYNNANTLIQNDIKKMVIVNKYLTNANEEDIKKDKKYKDNINDKNTFYHLINTATKDYFLKYELLTRKLIENWEFKNSNQALLYVFSTLKVNSVDSFNYIQKNFYSSIIKTQDSRLKLAVNDNVDTTKLFGYEGIKTSTNTKGDLDYSINGLKSQNTTLSGFWNIASDKIVSINDMKSADFFKGKKTVLPQLKTESKTKTSSEITDSDFQFITENNDATFSIHFIIPDESKFAENKKIANVVVKMQSKANPEYKFFYRVNVNWNEDTIKYSPTEAFDVPEIIKFINTLDAEKKSINISYINKIVPLFTERLLDKDATEVKQFFSLDQTVWNSAEEKNKLSYSLALLNDNTYNNAKEYYKSLGIEIKDKNPDIFPK